MPLRYLPTVLASQCAADDGRAGPGGTRDRQEVCAGGAGSQVGPGRGGSGGDKVVKVKSWVGR